jgi:hypothetical protein
MFGHYKLNQNEKNAAAQQGPLRPNIWGSNPPADAPHTRDASCPCPQALACYHPPPLAPVRSSAPRNRSLSAVCRAVGAVRRVAGGSTGPQRLAGGWGRFAALAVR